jgi:hypothetical protein
LSSTTRPNQRQRARAREDRAPLAALPPVEAAPQTYGHLTLSPDAIGAHGYRLSDVYTFLVERSGWQPGPVEPPSPWVLPPDWADCRAAFDTWRTAR